MTARSPVRRCGSGAGSATGGAASRPAASHSRWLPPARRRLLHQRRRGAIEVDTDDLAASGQQLQQLAQRGREGLLA